MDKRRGWTMIELLVVIVVMGVLSSLAVLKYIDLTRTAMTSRIVGEFVAVRLAALQLRGRQQQHVAGRGRARRGAARAEPRICPPDFSSTTRATCSTGTTWAPAALPDRDQHDHDRRAFDERHRSDPRLEGAVFRGGNTLTYVLIDPNGNY